jgi:hypothetical protein
MPKSKLDIIDDGHFAWEDKSRDVRIDCYKLVVWKLSPVLSSFRRTPCNCGDR